MTTGGSRRETGKICTSGRTEGVRAGPGRLLTVIRGVSEDAGGSTATVGAG